MGEKVKRVHDFGIAERPAQTRLLPTGPPLEPDAPAGRLRVARQAALDPPVARGWRKGAWEALGSPRGALRLQWRTGQLGRQGQTALCGRRAGPARPGGAHEAPLRV